MAKNTPNYEFEKPEQNDFYDVDVQNRNWDKAETALTEFDDSGSVDEIKSFPDFLKKFVTGNKLAVTMRNLKAGMQFVLHAGQIVNNCVTDNAGLPLSAAQGKALMDKYTQLYSDLNTTNNNLSNKADKTSLSSYALKSDLDSSKLKSMTFTARSDEYAQILIGNPGILICAVSKEYLLVRQDNGACRVIGSITQVELSFKRNVEVSGIAFYV